MSRLFPGRHPHPNLPPSRGKGLFGRLKTSLAKKRAIGIVIGLALLALFLAFNRFPKLDTVREDLAVVNAPVVECFQGFCIETEPETSFLERWWDFSVEYIRLVAVGMTFAFLMAGLTEAFLFPQSGRERLGGGVWRGTLRGLAVGPVMTLCSACIAPVAASLWRRGAGVAGTIATVQGSATLNIPALVMVALVFSPMLGGSRIVVSIVGALLIGPLVALIVRDRREPDSDAIELPNEPEPNASWRAALGEGLRDWGRLSLAYALRMAPIMAAAAFVSGLVIQWISPDTVSAYLGNDLRGVAIAATVGVLINVPLLFEIPLVALLLLLGMGEAPAAALLFTAAAGGPATFWALARFVPRRAIATFAGATWAFGIVGGIAILGVGAFLPHLDAGLRQPEPQVASVPPGESVGVARLGVAPRHRPPAAFADGQASLAPLPSFSEHTLSTQAGAVAVAFDYDRDGDQDVYVAAPGGVGSLFRRDDGAFVEVAPAAGLAGASGGGTAAAACDLDNDGYQDLYAGAGDGETDRLYRNGGGAFNDVTGSAFGGAANMRHAASVACADVDGDGLLDLYVGNLGPDAPGNGASLPGQYNALYLNRGGLTFDEVAESAGVRGPEITIRGLDGRPVLFEDAKTGREYEGYDPNARDSDGNPIGEPTGRTRAVLFFDYDDDGDPDLWTANDGDRLHVYRNDSTPGKPHFTPVARRLGIDRVGNWMSLALGDYDGDGDLDVLVGNAGSARLSEPPPDSPSGDCAYHARFSRGTCHPLLLRNDGETGGGPSFVDVAQITAVSAGDGATQAAFASAGAYPFRPPKGLAAHTSGAGAVFLDADNDGDMDLIWPAADPTNGAAGLLLGDGVGGFAVAYDGEPGAPDTVAASAVAGDLDGDGYADAVVSGSGGALVLLNGNSDGNWLSLRLVGRTALGEDGSNADGIGARVYVVTRPAAVEPPIVQVREADGGALRFGLGAADGANEIAVFWPSGREQRLRDVAGNGVVEVVEPAGE